MNVLKKVQLRSSEKGSQKMILRPLFLCSEACDGVGCRSPDGLIDDRTHGNDHGQCAGQDKDPSIDGNTISIVLQPVMHGPPGDGEGGWPGLQRSVTTYWPGAAGSR